MADNNIKIWAELTIDDKKLKTEFTKAWQEAGKSVAEWLEKQKSDIVWKMNDIADEIRTKMEQLQNFDFSLINPDKVEEDMQFLQNEMTSLDNQIQNIQRWSGWQEFWEEWREAFENVKSASEEYKDTLYYAMDAVQWVGLWVEEAMEWAEEQTKETTEAVKELNETASQWISENGWLWKMLKFLSSKEIVNFFYQNLKKIWEKLIELSGDSEQLANKRQPIQDKLEQVWWYIGKWLVPAVSTAIDEIWWMADELVKTGEDWSSALWMLQQWVFWIGQAFVAVIKVIKQVGQILGDVISNAVILVDSFASDVKETAQGFIENIWNPDMWLALWNNISHGIITWVNNAIGSLNKLLTWINENLGIDLWQIDTFDAGQKMDLWFWNFTKTKNARDTISKENNKFLKEMWNEWSDFWDNAMQGSEKLKNTSINDIKKIEDKTKKSVWKWWKAQDAYKELEDEARDIRGELDSLVEDHQKQYDKLTEEIEKVEDKYDELRDKAKDTWEEAQKALEEYSEKLTKAQWEAITDLWQRYVDLKKDLIGVDEYMKKVANDLSRKEIDSLQTRWFDEYKWYKLKDLINLKEKLDEMQLIEENTTEEQRQSEEFTKKTSKAQEILNDLKEKETELEQKKAEALEKQAIAQAMMNQENWKQYIKTIEDKWTFYYDETKKQRQQVLNEDNIAYAKQLENQTTNLNDQLKQYKDEKNNEVEILITTTASKIDLENNYHKVFQDNVKKQERMLDNIIAKEQQLVALRKEYLEMWWSVWHNAYWWSVLEWHASIVWENWPEQIIARQSSYVQPRNASNNYSTINNDNSFSINGINVNVSNMDEFLNELKEKLTYRS